MKKSILILALIIACSQLKAQQQPFQVKPADSLKNSLLQKYFNITPGSQQQFFQLQLNPNQTLALAGTPVKTDSYDHMPIASMQGYSKMPVAKLEGTEKMPVLKLGGSNSILTDPKKVTP
jgi:hypothetical protein